jgi:hypothetical protein
MDSTDLNPYIIDRRLRIREVLYTRDQELSELYWTAIDVLYPATPQRRRVSAHAIREMTAGLPRIIDVPAKESKQRLGDYVTRVSTLWKKARLGKSRVDGMWRGEIDASLQEALKGVDEMINWHEENRPKRKAVAAGFLRKSDPAMLELPANLQSDRASEWTELHDFFVGVAHGSATTEADFNARLDQLENLLLSSLSREPSQDFSTIDEILAEED